MRTSLFWVKEIMIFLNESLFVYNLENSRTVHRLWSKNLCTFFGALYFLKKGLYVK